MSICKPIVALGLAGLSLSAITASATTAADCGLITGPDVIVGEINDIRRWGESGGITSFTYALTLCNIGDTQAVFESNSNLHPVTAHNLYRWRPFSPGGAHGSFEQIGMSWASHHFFALSNNACCDGCEPTNGTTLGVKCSSPESSGITGSAFVLGPRSEINPVTGDFLFNHASPAGPTTLAGRVQAPSADLDQADALNTEAAYFVENHTISPDDAASGSDNNNVTHRGVNANSNGATHTLSFNGDSIVSPAILAWADIEPGVLTSIIDVPGDGRFIVASNASDQDGDGIWRYQYAVYNMNSAEATAEFAVPVPAGVSVTNISARDIDHHSGEPYDTKDWSGDRTPSGVRWAADAFTPAEDANAIRWGTMHSFSFDADTPPVTAGVSLTLFGSGGASPVFDLKAPRAACITDINGDGVTDAADLGVVIAAFGTTGPNAADLNGDDAVDAADLGILIAAFGSTCP